jgi:hypothetical protein
MQDSKCTYNVMLRHVHESLLPRKINKYYVFLSVLQTCGYLGAWACAYVHVALLIQHVMCMRIL